MKLLVNLLDDNTIKEILFRADIELTNRQRNEQARNFLSPYDGTVDNGHPQWCNFSSIVRPTKKSLDLINGR